MDEPDLRLLQSMVQRVLNEQKSFREFLEAQFAMTRSRDFRLEGRDTELHAVAAMLRSRRRRIAALQARPPAE